MFESLFGAMPLPLRFIVDFFSLLGLVCVIAWIVGRLRGHDRGAHRAKDEHDE
jgi:hypothetical protein